MALNIGLEEDNWVYNDAKFDGYMYYQEMAWQKPERAGTSRGLLTEVPDVGYAGWVCEFLGDESADRYDCHSVMVDLGENMSFGAPDLTDSSFKKKGVGFRCSVESAEDYDIAICLMPMPVATAVDPELGEYRYSPLDDNRIS